MNIMNINFTFTDDKRITDKGRKTILKLLFTFNAIIKKSTEMEVTPRYTLLTLLTLLTWFTLFTLVYIGLHW